MSQLSAPCEDWLKREGKPSSFQNEENTGCWRSTVMKTELLQKYDNCMYCALTVDMLLQSKWCT